MEKIKTTISYVQFVEDVSLFDVYNRALTVGTICNLFPNDGDIRDANEYVDWLISEGYAPLLKHVPIYLEIPSDDINNGTTDIDVFLEGTNPDSKWVSVGEFVVITTNYWFLYRNGILDRLDYMRDPTYLHKKLHTFKVVTDIEKAIMIAQYCEMACNYGLSDNFSINDECSMVISGFKCQWERFLPMLDRITGDKELSKQIEKDIKEENKNAD